MSVKVSNIKAAVKSGAFEILLWFGHRAVSLLRKWRVSADCFVVGVTGSCGKTTTKELIAAILSTDLEGVKSRGTYNSILEAVQLLFSFDSNNRFIVQEMGAWSPGRLLSFTRSLRPNVGVVTNIGWDHYKAFRGPEGVYKEKSVLIRLLPTEGIAVLNADDPRVMEMSRETTARVITYGLTEKAQFKAENVKADWPNRLSFTLVYDGKKAEVKTRFCGEYLIHNVLAALATGISLNVSTDNAIAAVEKVEPTLRRMQPVRTPDDIWFVRDDWKAPYWTLDAFFRFAETAVSGRKILVLGEISDRPGSSKSKYRRIVQRGSEVADRVVLIGPWWRHSYMESICATAENVVRFVEIGDANRFLDSYLKSGDLVLLKGNVRVPIGRLMLARTETVRCWITVCTLNGFCDACPHLAKGFPAD